MVRLSVRKVVQTAIVTVSFLFLFAVVAFAQTDRRQGEPGQFDYYVLALSWSPSYCEASQERSPGRSPDMQCGGRPFSFVVHGLWPQYERGFPLYCRVPAPRLNRAIVGSMLDLMPSPRLVFHQWDRHGTCSGLSPHAYFETVRKARAVVKIPDDYLELDKPRMVTADDVAEAFVKANPGLNPSHMTISCDHKRLTEIRVCITREFAFRDCGETTRRACRSRQMVMPAVRGGG